MSLLILVVDDEPDVAVLFRQHFRRDLRAPAGASRDEQTKVAGTYGGGGDTVHRLSDSANIGVDLHQRLPSRSPSDAAWPSAADWEKLKQDVGGQLIEVQPLLAPCADRASSAVCQDVIKQLKNPYYLGDQPVGTQTAGWLDAWMSAPSAYAVPARKTADIVAVVNFGREYKLRLVIKGGGHSYQGTSGAADSLLIWTRAMNGIVLHDEFVAARVAAARPSALPG